MGQQEPRHQGISWRDTGTQKGYIVQRAGRTYGGFHTTYRSALRTLQEATGAKSLQSLPLKPRFRKASPGNKKPAST